MGRLWAVVAVVCAWSRPHVLSQQCLADAPLMPDLGLPLAARCGQSCSNIELRPEDRCIYDISQCSNLQSGALCKVKCKAPYIGSSRDAVCPVSPTGEVLPPDWQKPSCEAKCPDPVVMPMGYKKWKGTWMCNGTWLGIPKPICHVHIKNCSAELRMFGCAPPQKCLLEHHHFCAFETGHCPERWPKSTCQVKCKAPFVGNAVSKMTCAAGNTNASRPADLSPLPLACELTCEPPSVPPEGYVERDHDDDENENSSALAYLEDRQKLKYKCDEGYAGHASTYCVVDEECASHMRFTGCLPLQNCVAPPPKGVLEGCMYDYSGCDDIEAGESCKVHCQSPYLGNSSTAMCPGDNVIKDFEVVGKPPTCTVICSSLYDVKPEYTSHPFQVTNGKWSCVHGYAGNATARCTTDSNCDPRLDLQGCKLKVACAMPSIPWEERCLYDILDCISTFAGDTCKIKCRSPYVGDPAEASCPSTNTDKSTQLTYTKPVCYLQCPVPRPARWGTKLVKGKLERLPADPGFHPGYSAPVILKTGQVVEMGDGSKFVLDSPRQRAAPWKCAPGYTGTAHEDCFTDGTCNRHLKLSGCRQLHTCIIPLDSPCWIDWGDCQKSWKAPHGGMVVGVWPGESCRPRCNAPTFIPNIGDTSVANCSDNNINADLELTYNRPSCQQVCLDPPAPAGYVNLKDAFQCSSGYARNDSLLDPMQHVNSRCAARPKNNCRPLLGLSHCAKLEPCLLPKVIPCQLNMTSCKGVKPGESCEVRCKAPFFGKTLPAFCPAGNTDPKQEMFWVTPDCQVECPVPNPIPEGYVKDPGCGWQCAADAAGTARSRCFADSACTAHLELKGCKPMRPCAAAALIGFGNDTCRLNVTDCYGVMPGKSCDINCKDPYSHNATVAKCPHWNTDAEQPPIFEDMDCALICPDPEMEFWPIGYTMNKSTYEWTCNTGYTGNPLTWCTLNATCFPVKQFRGCQMIKNCIIPDLNPCEYDTTACGVNPPCPRGKVCTFPPITIAPGWSCPITCMWPGLGTTAWAKCPPFNTDPLALDYYLPACNLGCSEPTATKGYTKLSGRWLCAEGYTGLSPRVDCKSLAGCIVHPVLSGCVPLQPCKPIELFGENACRLNAAKCARVMPQETCKVSCKIPYLGSGAYARCPEGNTDPEKKLPFYPPYCKCPWPFPPPKGYWIDQDENWHCEDGFTGKAVATCSTILATCGSQVDLTGCLPVSKCFSHSDFEGGVELENSCKLNATDCQEVPLGGSCEVTCKPPYFGNTTGAKCSATNTDGLRGLNYEEPECGLKCEGAELSTGYEAGQWNCAPGYDGIVSEKCVFGHIPGQNCSSAKILSGCNKLVPCKLPEKMIMESACRLDFDDCKDNLPGTFCEVKCKSPYSPGMTKAFCPPGNIDPNYELIWTEPDCYLECVPAPYWAVPKGYHRTETCGWQCAEGYFAPIEAKVGCDVDEECRVAERFRGCVRVEACDSPPPAWNSDPCQYDISECLKGVIAAGTACEVKCKAPYNPNSTMPGCPWNNIKYRAPLPYVEPFCELECPVPDPMTPGYEKAINGTYYCAPRYAGSITVTCVTDALCKPTLTLAGCLPIVPCLVDPDWTSDPCMFDYSSCANFKPGTTCNVFCKTPYVGSVRTLECPSSNTEMDFIVPGDAPHCELVCPHPIPFTTGYTFTWETELAHFDMIDNSTAEGLAGYQNTTKTLTTSTSTTSTATVTTQKVYGCAAGYVGNVTPTCEIQHNCSAPLQLFGCDEMMPCARPKVAQKDICKFDLSACMDVSQGSSCPVRCRSPYVGVATKASCPAFNIDRKTMLSIRLPECVFECPALEAIHMPVGAYSRKDVNSSWECAVGFTGIPRYACSPDSACNPRKELVGCKEMKPCIMPNVDKCRTSTSKCVGLKQGAKCDASCRAPYVGSSFIGSCAALNTDPKRLLVWSAQPNCSCPWPSLSEIPKGHQRNGSIWNCTTGYAGKVAAACVQHADCRVTWSISGCIKTVPCMAPLTMFAAIPDQCKTVAPGKSCLARCLPTTCVAGGPLRLSCPLTNINPERITDLSGQCRVRCEVCTLGQLWDVDSRSGYLSGNLPFGPAHAEGGVLTAGIEGFYVYFANTCLEKIGGVIAYVPTNSSTPRACCSADQYIAVLRGVRIPSDAGILATRLLVTINTISAGELPVGVSTNFTDRSWNFTRKSIAATIKDSSAQRLCGNSTSWVLFAIVMVIYRMRLQRNL